MSSSAYKESLAGSKSGSSSGASRGAAMLRPGYPGGVPYPPRPGEQAVRYVFPPGAGAGAGGPPPGAPYSARDAAAAAALSSAYARQVSKKIVQFPLYYD